MEGEDSRDEPEDVVLNAAGGDFGATVVQTGRVRDVIIYQHPGPRPDLPHRIGAVPSRVGCFQQRWSVDAGEFLPAGAGRVLSGLGGVGKTQVAADLAERLWVEGEIELLVWVAASSREAITSAYAAAAAELGWDPDGNPDRGAQRFLAGLSALSRHWLVVLDDLRSPGDATGLWPPDRPQGRIVATTRRRDAALAHDRRELVDIGVFTREQSLTYLTARLADRPRGAEGGAELAADLGHLPLALAQAAAYVLDEDLTCHEYRALLADRGRRLADVLPEQEALPDDQADPVTATFALSVELAGRLRPVGLAPEVLDVAAMLDPHGIPAEVFTSTVVREHLERATGKSVDQHEVRSALRCLHRLNLVTEDSGANSRQVRVHALVQRAARDQLTENRLGVLVHIAANGLHEVWPQERSGDLIPTLRANTEALHPHAPGHLYECCCHPLLFLVGGSLGNSGLVTAAVEHYQRMRDTAVRYSDPEQHGVLAIRLELAWWRGEAGELAAAVDETQQVVDARSRLAGPDHPTTLRARINLARLRSEGGDAAAGIAELNDVVPDLIRVLGPDHGETLEARLCLANDQAELGDAAASATAMEVLLADMLRTREWRHPGVLSVRHHLALRHAEAEQFQRAAAEFEQLLEDRLQVQGPDHPHTLQTRGLLATCRASAGATESAVTELAELVQDRLRVHGPEHPATLVSRKTLSMQRAAAGDSEGALAELEELVPDALRILGPLHPDTLSIRHDYAIRRGEVGDPEGAAAILADIVADTQQVLDPRSPNALATRHNLAYWRAAAGATADALAQLEDLLPEVFQVLGPDHPHTRAIRLNIDRLRGED